MCTLEPNNMTIPSPSDPDTDHGRPVLQPSCNRVPTLERRASLKRISQKTPPPPPPPPPPRAAATTKAKPGTPPSPRLRSPRPLAVKRPGAENPSLNSSSEKVTIPRASQLTRSATLTLERKKSKKWNNNNNNNSTNNNINVIIGSRGIVESPGSIAAGRREQMALQHEQRKMRIAHYGRSKSAKYESKVVPLVDSLGINNEAEEQPAVLERRCTFITPNSVCIDPLYVAYHDEEWGVPVHDDKMLFELLVLSGLQVGSDWTSILKKRQDFREVFSGFDAETVANLTEKQMNSISAHYSIDLSKVRAVVDNANGILQVKKEFGSFDKYIWGFVNGKPISPQYRFAHKIPIKTSKSESISKDLVRRGFRAVGPTAVHSFMQAAGLTNDHLIMCFRQLECTALASRRK